MDLRPKGEQMALVQGQDSEWMEKMGLMVEMEKTEKMVKMVKMENRETRVMAMEAHPHRPSRLLQDPAPVRASFEWELVTMQSLFP
jgi:hypothetical protein